jgi:hypothetical protein
MKIENERDDQEWIKQNGLERDPTGENSPQVRLI